MQILLSPSEAKLSPKEIAKIAINDAQNNPQNHLQKNPQNTANNILDDNLWGGKEARNKHIKAYLQELAKSNDFQIAKIFGTKRVDLDTLEKCLNLASTPRIKAIKLYNGVAYKALDFDSLEEKAQDFILESTLIFSNLFGLVRAKDALPYYHLNQNYRSNSVNLNSLYSAQKNDIDAFLGLDFSGISSAKQNQHIIIDLRASVYVKAYPLKRARLTCPHYILPIPKGTSHQAKLHRGLALRELAKTSIQGKNAIQKMLDEKFIFID
ncbi:peroxide stress protein YaaA [Helicobacter sp. T3_23-1056]